MKTPSFWYKNYLSVSALALWPLTLIWRLGGVLKAQFTKTVSPHIPVVIIGNLTAGGTGKTPLVASLAAEAKAKKRHPVILMRGHGGQIKKPHWVTPQDQAVLIGDEACLLRNFAPVVISPNRGEGAQFIEKIFPECDLILMDDGLQNPSIQSHFNIAVFNARLGIGNGMIIPSGPLREKFGKGLDKIDVAVITGDDTGFASILRKNGFDKLIFQSQRHLNPTQVKSIKGKRIMAFAGIGHPDGFFTMLKNAGLDVTSQRSFPDHHIFTKAELVALYKQAEADQAILVTTEKDFARLAKQDQDKIIPMRLETSLDGSLLDIVLKAQV